ncbi:unnamed protein product [Lepeophtheirus salmonis]|uniref:(salmon louse) hypothetical protein n=2 Tax=Lepeophtheirus salmonis TaxID=72036 RepID=A0A0K2V8K9_LEPSM|nr:uncharacterized protein LOC121122770 [Lepeophtheirus salmonis]XP_040573744.1 uncharacterized protein LOC121122771 [Lepeophtheirus salmonis]XP_040574270.1 uncharacterized protein LOC121123204 [Lepeophtheirus salmonis]XP_040574279.1 uncharacterized protein LOC121123213 [Lepeophtheirus salmonis]CAB4068616.1 unnamed protein product [Lepeophtheirus salmonis]CAB4068617.1 unnamed protein product [Lepeophtheirus salmonis]CAF3012584.1 unnamed protein product [Lepeophtheirus salmonis]CAF3012604.1 u
MKAFAVTLLTATLAFAAHPPAYGPQIYCRDTNTSIYADVCTPSIAVEQVPVERNVKNVQDNEYCYEQVRTVCEETSRSVDREICTYTYEQKPETLSATTTQVTYETKSETMKVTTCSAAAPAYGHYAPAKPEEHQYCREEYQTQSYSVPLVDTPLEVPVELSVPEPKKICVTKAIQINEVVCNDIKERKCFNVAITVDAVETVEQSEVKLGEPDCNTVTLTLPTQACSKPGYHY